MSDKLRIAQVVGRTGVGGVSNCILNYFKAIDRSVFQFDFITFNESFMDDEIRKLGGEVLQIPDFRRFPSACRAFKKILLNGNYDIVHSNLTSLSVFPLYVAKKVGIKHRICHSHSVTDNKEALSFVKNFLKKPSVKCATDYFACSRAAADWMFGADNNAVIIPNAIDIGRFRYDLSARERVRRENSIDGFCVGFAGRFCYAKNLEFFLAVADGVQKKIGGTAVLVGGGNETDKLKKIAKDYGLNARFIPGTDSIEEYYSAFDCLVMPSKYEGLGMVGVECQASGLSCYFSEAVPREADCGKAVFLPIDDPGAWADIIVKNSFDTERNAPLDIKKFDINAQVKLLEKEYLRIARGV